MGIWYNLYIKKCYFQKIKIMKKISAGFTLLELLIVVSIIGILTSIILVSLSSARGKGADAGIKSNLHTLSNQNEIFFSSQNSYLTAPDGSLSGTCPTTYSSSAHNMFRKQPAYAALAAAVALGGSTGSCYVSDNAWAVAVALKTDATQSWCVDSTGISRQVSSSSPINTTTLVCN